jgi:hypothetical protein
LWIYLLAVILSLAVCHVSDAQAMNINSKNLQETNHEGDYKGVLRDTI